MMDVSWDLRGMPVWERAETVLDRARQLHAGDSFDFTMEFEPRPLVTRVEQESGIVHCRWQRVGEHEWRVTVTRPVESPGASPLTTALRRSIFRDVSPDALAMLAESMCERTARKNE